MKRNKIIQGNSTEELKKLPDESIDMVVTSPPYYGLRDYNEDKQIGLEETFEEYLQRLLVVTKECQRVLKPKGTLWWVHGDSYCTQHQAGTTDEKTGWKSEGNKRNPTQKKHGRGGSEKIPIKSLMMQPYRLAQRMVDEQGWILRNIIIWHKPSCMPSSVKDRFTVDFEPVFFFSKNEKYYFEQQFECAKTTSTNSSNGTNENSKYGNIKKEKEMRQGLHKKRGSNFIEKRNLPDQEKFVDKLRGNYSIDDLVKETGLPRTHIEHWFRYDKSGFAYPSKEDWEKVDTKLFPELTDVEYEPDAVKHSKKDKRNKRTVWSINPKPFPEAHFAVYPPKLIETPIRAGCPKEVCKKCGKAREKEYEVVKKGTARDTSDYAKKLGRPNGAGHRERGDIIPDIKVSKGYTDCGCNAGFKPGIVLDPFMGAGTTAVVARKLGRDYLGIELNKEYIKIAKKRLKQQTLRF